MFEDISERSLIFYFRKSIKFKVSLSYVNYLLHSKIYTTAGQYTDYSTLDCVPLVITVYGCVTAYL